MTKIFRGLFLLLSLTLSVEFMAQQDIQMTHFTFDRLSINPGFAGSKAAVCVTGMYRQQWSGFDGAPTTTLLNAHMPLTRAKSGVGLSFISDELGQEKNTIVRGIYSYHLPNIGNGKLGLGIGIGMTRKTLGNEWIAIDPVANDPSIPINGVTSGVFDLSFGAYYYTPKYYVGLSSTHLTEGELTDMRYTLARHYYLMAGYTHELNATIDIEPSILVKSDAAATTFDLNVRGIYNDLVWFGLTYRLDDAIAPMAGVNYNFPDNRHSVKFGYSFDVTTSELRNHSNGTHEIMLNFCKKLFKPLPEKVYKNVRYL